VYVLQRRKLVLQRETLLGDTETFTVKFALGEKATHGPGGNLKGTRCNLGSILLSVFLSPFLGTERRAWGALPLSWAELAEPAEKKAGP
jgi:hypothetical protein